MPPTLFPSIRISEALEIAKVIANKNAGQPMRRLDVFQELRRSPDSGTSRSLVTASSAYELTNGSYQAEQLSLTPLGTRAAVVEDPAALIDAVLRVDIFKKFFDTYRNNALPSEVATRSFLASNGVPTDRTMACLEVLLASGREAGLIAQISGTDRVLSPEHAKERISQTAPQDDAPARELDAEKSGRAASGTFRPTPTFHVNLEIHLPSEASPETYEAIFSSMRKHLIDVA